MNVLFFFPIFTFTKWDQFSSSIYSFKRHLVSTCYLTGTTQARGIQSRLKHGSRNLYYCGKGLDMVLRPLKAKHKIQDFFQKRIIMRTLDAHHPILLSQLQRQKSRSRNFKYFIQGHTGSHPLYLGVQPLSSNLFYI